MTETSPVILNDGSVAKDTALETDEIEKNIRIIITKLKGKYMNEGRISMWCIVDQLFYVTHGPYIVFNAVWSMDGWIVYEVFSNLIVIPLQMAPEWIT